MANPVPQTKPTGTKRTFRPWPENQMHFEFAERAKFNVSELINEIVAKHFKRHLETKVHAQTKALAALTPARGSKPQLQKSRR